MKVEKRTFQAGFVHSGFLSKRALIAVVAGGIAIHAALGVWSIVSQSPTFDEPLHLAAGYVYWTTRDYRVNALHHPPLSSLVAAVPLLFQNLDLPEDYALWKSAGWKRASDQYTLANRFLYHNPSGAPPERLMAAGRLAILAVDCLFLLGFFWLIRRRWGDGTALAGFFLAVWSPTLLAHGSLVTTDYLFMASYFMFFAAWGQWHGEGGSLPWAAAAGIFLGLSFCSKFSAVAIGPVIVLYAVLKRFRLSYGWKEWGAFVFSAAAVLSIVYQFTALPLFWEGLQYTLARVQAGRASFILGRHATEGVWYYFPVTVALKTPLPTLAGLALLLMAGIRRRLRWPLEYWLPPLVYFILACASAVQIGHRHVLPVYPFLFLGIALAVRRFASDRPRRALVLFLGVWLMGSVLKAGPFYISYFNEAVGGPSRGYKALTDSNVDWGQGMKALKDFLAGHGVGAIYLSYFGTAEPGAYGIRYAALGPYTLPSFPDEEVDVTREPRALLVVSATNFQSTYYSEKDVFDWLKNREPLAVVADSLLVFDVTQDAETRWRLSALFERLGRPVLAARERRVAEELGSQRVK